MQTKRHTMPSARSRAQIKRSVLNTLPKSENINDDSWLNDMHSVSLTSVTQTQEHTVCYEDLPTMPLSLFASLPIQQTASSNNKEDSADEDKTVKLPKLKKSTPVNPLDTLLSDESITGITALGPQRIFIERNGMVQQMPLQFASEQHMMQVIEQLLQTVGQPMPTHHLLAGLALPDGFVLTLALPPDTPHGPALTLRRQPKNILTLNDLVRGEAMSQAMADTLTACVRARLNIIICGHNGSGRTTLLNALCAAIPENERIVTIEDQAELLLQQPQVMALQTYEHGAEHTTIQELFTYAERTHADRIILGECRGNEAAMLLPAMYSGLDGVMTTMYGHSVKDCLTRLETLCLVNNGEHSASLSGLIRTQIAQSINIVISLSLGHKITNIAEVQSVDEGPLKIQSLFHYQDGKRFAAKSAHGSFEASGFYPEFVERCRTLGIALPRDTFMA